MIRFDNSKKHSFFACRNDTEQQRGMTNYKKFSTIV